MKTSRRGSMKMSAVLLSTALPTGDRARLASSPGPFKLPQDHLDFGSERDRTAAQSRARQGAPRRARAEANCLGSAKTPGQIVPGDQLDEGRCAAGENNKTASTARARIASITDAAKRSAASTR